MSRGVTGNQTGNQKVVPSGEVLRLLRVIGEVSFNALLRRLRRVWLIFWDSEIVCKRHYFSNFAFNTKKYTLVNTNIGTVANTKKDT